MTTNLNRRLARYAPAVLSLFRSVYGLLFAGYGSMILFSWPVCPTWPVQVGAWPGWYAGLIELVTGLLIATGLFTRAAAFIAPGEMAVGYFSMHQPRSLWPIGIPGGQWRNFGDSLLLRFLPAGLHGRGQLRDRRPTGQHQALISVAPSAVRRHDLQESGASGLALTQQVARHRIGWRRLGAALCVRDDRVHQRARHGQSRVTGVDRRGRRLVDDFSVAAEIRADA